MAARHRQRNLDFAARRRQHEARAVAIGPNVARADVGAGLEADADDAAAVCALDEIRRERIVGIDDRRAIGSQGIVDRGLGVGDAEQAAHPFQVGRRDVVDQRHVRPRDRGQVGDIAGLARTHLVHRESRVVRRVQHRQRQADLVVAVAGIGVGATCLVKDRQQQGLHAGLAIAAGDRQHPGRTFALHRGGEIAQRALGIGHHDLRDRSRDLARDECGDAAAAGCGRDMVVTVEILALQRDEQGLAPLRQRAGIGGDGIDGAIRADHPATGHIRDPGEQPRLHARLRRSSRAVAVSSNGCLMPLISW